MEKQWKQWLTIFLGSKITADGDCSHEIKRSLVLDRKVMTNLDSILKNRDIVNKGLSSQGYVFSSGHVWMWELDYKESWVPKNWCFWTVVLEKTLESPLDSKEIKSSHSKGNQPWVFNGRTDVEPETPILLATWCEELTHLKRPWCWERLRAGKGDDRGWYGWMASPTQWTWVWVDSGSWWWTGMPGVLQFMGSQRVRHDWATELNWHKGFLIVNKAETDVFWDSFAFSIIKRMLAIWPLFPMPFLNPAWTSGHSQFLYCWSLAWRILSITSLACEMSAIVW